MLTTIRGYYENGRVVLTEAPPVTEKTEVVVVFPSDSESKPRKRILGLLEGKATLPDDFDEPLDELKDYM